ncbi:MAG: ATP-binding protein [bacterium]
MEGYGLGLSIAKKIIALHKGSIEVDSQPGKGSTFLVKLPLFS